METTHGRPRYITSASSEDRAHSGGRASGVRIVVTFGRDESQHLIALLHEATHTIVAQRHTKDVSHGRIFYRTAFRLYQRYAIDRTLALEFEGSYKKRSVGYLDRYWPLTTDDVFEELAPEPSAQEPDDEWSIASAMDAIAAAVDEVLRPQSYTS